MCSSKFLFNAIQTSIELLIGGAVETGCRGSDDAEPVVCLVSLLNAARHHRDLPTKRCVRLYLTVSRKVIKHEILKAKLRIYRYYRIFFSKFVMANI